VPNIADFNSASSAATDREHDVQLGLLQALCSAVADNRDAASVSEIRLGDDWAQVTRINVSDELP